MKFPIVCTITASVLFPGMAAAQTPPKFVGTAVVGPAGCQTTPKCELQSDFGYVDRNGVGWKANAGFMTDGASIPRWAQWFAGDPWDPSYLKAAVLHDWYSKSERPVYGWLQTQRMFREVLLQSGVSLGKANLLYTGVLIGSGKWIWSIEGQKCDIGTICIQQAGKFEITKEPATWDTPEYKASFEKMKGQTESLASASAEDVEALVASELANPVYVEEKDGVIETTSPSAGREKFLTK